MWLALMLVALEAAVAYVTLDLFFRYMPLEPVELRRGLTRYALYYGGIGTLACVAGVLAQWGAAGRPGLVAGAALNWVPWWMLWRFGLRKQFTYLFKSDGGRPVETQKPDP